MEQPVILLVDDQTETLQTLARAVRQRYTPRFAVMTANDADGALAIARQLHAQGRPLALFVADLRLSLPSGHQLLVAAAPFLGNAKRAMLTPYTDTEAAAQAMSQALIDYPLRKPWEPADEHLYPVLDDLLEDWLADSRPLFEGIRLIGLRWSPHTHQVKEFLARNLAPYQWLDAEMDGEARRLLALLDADSALPVLLFPDGSYLARPTLQQIAEKIGLDMRADLPLYDLAIIGGGPAGLAAAVYGASEGLRTLLIEREAPGGQAGASSQIENYLGFPVGLSGSDLTRRAVAQARRFGAEIVAPLAATAITLRDGYRLIQLNDGSEVNARAILIATGVAYRKLDAPGIDALTGAGVYYGAATTEALACADQDVFIVGGGNSAGQAALYLAKYARSVTMLVRGEALAGSMSHYLIRELEAAPQIHVRLQCSVVAAHGQGALRQITIADAANGSAETVDATALFIFIGAVPHTDWLAGTIARDERGFILCGPDLMKGRRPPAGWPLARPPYWLETSTPGIFAAGDVRHGSVKRIASAVGEGAMAVQFAQQYLAEV